MNDGAGTHDARLQRANQRGPRKPIIPGAPGGLPHRHDFRVAGRIAGRDRMIVAASDDGTLRRHNHSTHRHFPRGQGHSGLLECQAHQFVVHPRMLNYRAMKSLRGLLLALLLLPSAGWAQGVRMSADFLPLEVGKRWRYEVTNEAGQKAGQLEFAVEELTIVSGISYYALSEFPFSPATGEPVRLVRYDRGERYFIRKAGNNEGPLFLDDSATTEVIETDSSGAPQKFVLKMEKLSLTFQRSVGIIEARLQQAGGTMIAKLVAAPSTSTARPAEPVAAPTDRALIPPPIPVVPNRREAPVAAVSAQNPRVEVAANASPEGYRFVLVVINTAEKLLPLRFTSGQTYDFVVRDTLADKEIWRWSTGNFFTQVIRNESIRPESKWQFEVTLDRKDNDGKPVPPGSYRLTATLTSSPLIQTSIPLNLP